MLLLQQHSFATKEPCRRPCHTKEPYVVRACLAAGSNRLKPVRRLDHTREHDGQEDEEGDYCNMYSIVATGILPGCGGFAFGIVISINLIITLTVTITGTIAIGIVICAA